MYSPFDSGFFFRWLAPIMLIVDQCEKAAIASKRKAEAKHILVGLEL